MIVWLVGAIAVLSLLGGIYWTIDDRAYDRGKNACQEELRVAQEKLQKEAAKRKEEAEVKIQDMVSAFDAGEKKGVARQRSLEQKGINHVTNNPVFRNPECVLPPDSLLELNAARSSVRSSSDSSKTP